MEEYLTTETNFLSFNGFCGQFKELPKRNSMAESEYATLVENVLNKSYFLT